jgi:hypothetical protein
MSLNEWRYAEALESQIATIRYCAEMTDVWSDPRVHENANYAKAREVLTPTANDLIGAMADQVALLKTAQPMYWGRTVSDLVVEVSKQIEHDQVVTPDLLYCQSAWCWFEIPLVGLLQGFGDGTTSGISALSWAWVREKASDGHDEWEGLVYTGWRRGKGLENVVSMCGYVRNGERVGAVLT